MIARFTGFALMLLGLVASPGQAIASSQPESPATDSVPAEASPAPTDPDPDPEPEPDDGAELPSLRPGDDSYVPGETVQWRSGNDLRYTWRLPATYTRGSSHDLVLLLHGQGEDYRWGSRVFDPATFRPDDIVIGVDGPTESDDGTRLFVGEMADVYAVREFLLEISRTFPIRGIFLCGHEQGGFFVSYFAGEFPALADGGVAISAGAWGWARDEGSIQSVPLVFVHAIDDSVVPYRQSPLARDHYASLGHETTRVRRLLSGGHTPDGRAASDGIDWCKGMKLTRPDECLEMAQRLMERSSGDARPLGMARDLLERIMLHADEEPQPHGVPEMEDPVSPETRAATEALIAEIDAYGGRQSDALAAIVGRAPEVALDGSPWLGHVLAAFEDLGGVPAVDAYLRSIQFPKQRDRHVSAASAMYEVWFGDESVFEGDVYAAASDALPRSFLADGLPVDFVRKMRGWREIAAALDARPDTIEKYEFVDLYERGMRTGADGYRSVAASWRAPEPEPERPVPEAPPSQAPEPVDEAPADVVPSTRSWVIWLIPIGVALLLGVVIAIAARR